MELVKVINLEGRIDSSNIVGLEEKVFSDINSFLGTIILDLKNLEYISSSGLRLILKIKKIHQNVRIINCNENIYDIFEIAGFQNIIDIEKTEKSFLR